MFVFNLRALFLNLAPHPSLSLEGRGRTERDMEIGRQGIAGNGYTSRVWKGDGPDKADSLKHGSRLFYFGMLNAECGVLRLCSSTLLEEK